MDEAEIYPKHKETFVHVAVKCKIGAGTLFFGSQELNVIKIADKLIILTNFTIFFLSGLYSFIEGTRCFNQLQ